LKIQNKVSPTYFIFLIIILLSCSQKMNKKNLLPENYTGEQLIFGSGGGFTNLVHEYRLLENRRFFHKKSTDSTFSELQKQDSKVTKQLFEKSRVLFNEVKDLNEPGNLYYFIRFQKEGKTQKIIWGSSKGNVPEKAKDLYKELMNLVHLE